MEKILVSACLLGTKCRYDGKDNLVQAIKDLGSKYDLVPFCPEQESGLPTPREPSEIFHGMVKHKDGSDVTRFYNDGAQKALNICKFLGIRIAILKDYSPACGVRQIHDGSFTGKKIPGQGFTAQYLSLNGIKVYCENDVLTFLSDTPEQLAAKEEKKEFNIKKAQYITDRAAAERKYKADCETATAAGQPLPEKPAILTEPNPYAKPEKKEFRSFHKSNDFHKSSSFHKEGEVGAESSENSEEKPFHKDFRHGDGNPRSFHHEGGYRGGYGHKEGGYQGHSSYGHKPYGHHDYRNDNDTVKPEGSADLATADLTGEVAPKPAYKKPYGHSSYGHSSYGHGGYGHKEGGYQGHSSYHKDGEGHSSYGHKSYGHSSYHKDGESSGYQGHSSYHKDGGSSGYQGHSSYGHGGYGHKEGGYQGHSSYHKDGEGHSSYGHKSYGHSSFHKDGSSSGYKGGYKKSYSGHSSYKGGHSFHKDSTPKGGSGEGGSSK
jgi:uncharacterized protein YbbK (DUF523 family)